MTTMEDEVFEKVFERIEDVFELGTSFDGNELVIDDYLLTEDERKQKLRQILEEIENNAKGEVLHQVFDKEAKP